MTPNERSKQKPTAIEEHDALIDDLKRQIRARQSIEIRKAAADRLENLGENGYSYMERIECQDIRGPYLKVWRQFLDETKEAIENERIPRQKSRIERQAQNFLAWFGRDLSYDFMGSKRITWLRIHYSIHDELKSSEKAERVDAIHGIVEPGAISFEELMQRATDYVALGGDRGWIDYCKSRESFQRQAHESELHHEERIRLSAIIIDQNSPIAERQLAATSLSDLGYPSALYRLQELLDQESGPIPEIENGDEDQDNKVARLAFEILPPDFLDTDEYYEHFDNSNSSSIDNSSKERKERLAFVSNLGSHTKYIGSNEFGTKYLAFEFKSHVVAECPLEGNAIYIIKGLTDWQNMLRESKKELRSNYPGRVRKIIHKTDWQSRVKEAVNWPNV